MTGNNISRKEFFKRLGIVALIPFGAAWYSSIARDQAYSHDSIVRLNYQAIENGITIADDIIINKKDNDIKILSARCTHLGCKLNKVENNEIVCPCHGSRFSLNGKVLKGPANNNLEQLPYRVDKSTKEIIIDVPA